MTSGDANDERNPARVPVARFRRVRTANDYALVILSMKLPYWLMEEEGRYVLYVPVEYEGEAREQIERYRRESAYWPPVERTDPVLSVPSAALWLYAVVLVVIFFRSHAPGAAGEAWFAAGRVDAGRMLEYGEWYRGITALTLHADIGHLAGNLAGGALFAFFLMRVLGGGLSWLLILGAGALGNTLNVLVRAEAAHLSVGASTAVFGALGAIVGYQVLREFRTGGRFRSRRLWAPLAAGLVLLGFLGAGGERTDVLAHAWGFLAGGAVVVPFAWKDHAWIRSAPLQFVLGLVVAAVVSAAWLAAFARL